MNNCFSDLLFYQLSISKIIQKIILQGCALGLQYFIPIRGNWSKWGEQSSPLTPPYTLLVLSQSEEIGGNYLSIILLQSIAKFYIILPNKSPNYCNIILYSLVFLP